MREAQFRFFTLLLRCGFRTAKLVTITQAIVVAKFTRSTASGSDGRLHYGYTLPQHHFRDGRIQPLRHASSAQPQRRAASDSEDEPPAKRVRFTIGSGGYVPNCDSEKCFQAYSFPCSPTTPAHSPLRLY